MRATYITYNTLNTSSTINATFCNETDMWLKNLIKKSNLISTIGEKQRYRFINHNMSNLKKLIATIENS